MESKASATAVPRGWYQRDDAPADVQIVFERELGYTFHRNSWGQGYASEAARCVFDYAREVLRVPRVISLIHPENHRSLRVVQRFQVEREDIVEVLSRPFVRFAWPVSEH